MAVASKRRLRHFQFYVPITPRKRLCNGVAHAFVRCFCMHEPDRDDLLLLALLIEIRSCLWPWPRPLTVKFTRAPVWGERVE